MHLAYEQLIACLDHECGSNLCEHLDQCLTCADCLEPYRSLQEDLRRALYRRDCPDSQTLNDYHFGFLPAVESGRVSAHLAECPHCAAELVGLVAFLGRR